MRSMPAMASPSGLGRIARPAPEAQKAACASRLLLRITTNGTGFDLVYDTIGGQGLDNAFLAVSRFGHVVSCLGWGTHALAPLSFKAATYSGVFTLLPLLTGEGRAHHGEIMREATKLIEAGHIVPKLDPRRFALGDAEAAHALIETRQSKGKLVIEVD